MPDPLWVKLVIASIPLAYTLASALIIVLWKLNKCIISLQVHTHTTRTMVQGLIQKHAKRHDGECEELLNWLGEPEVDWLMRKEYNG